MMDPDELDGVEDLESLPGEVVTFTVAEVWKIFFPDHHAAWLRHNLSRRDGGVDSWNGLPICIRDSNNVRHFTVVHLHRLLIAFRSRNWITAAEFVAGLIITEGMSRLIGIRLPDEPPGLLPEELYG